MRLLSLCVLVLVSACISLSESRAVPKDRSKLLDIAKKIVKEHLKLGMTDDMVEKITESEFKLFDEDNDEVINLSEEVQDKLDELDYADVDLSNLETEAVDFMSVLATDDDEKSLTRNDVILELILNRAQNNLQTKELGYQKEFKDFDDDGDGMIDIKEELPNFLHKAKMSITLPEWQLKEATKYDKNKDGMLSSPERAKFIDESIMIGDQLGIVGSFAMVNLFDKDNDKHIGIPGEIKPLMKVLGQTQQVWKLITYTDRHSNDKRLSLDEMRKLLKRYIRLGEENLKIVAQLVHDFSEKITVKADI